MAEPRAFALLGGGGHARSVADVLDRLGHPVSLVIDPTPPGDWSCDVIEEEAMGFAECARRGLGVVPAIGDNVARQEITRRAIHAGMEVAVICAATATVSRTARLGHGSVVLEHAHVGPRAKVGVGSIVNTSSIIEHDCRVGDGVHIAPGAFLAGDVVVDDLAHVGMRSAVLEGRHIGAAARVGAGAVVIRSVTTGQTVVGVPARPWGELQD